MFAQGPGGRWLVKTYGGNEDRVATEALSNAIYREMGAVVPAAGLHERDGKKALAYPTVEGKIKWDGPSRQVGAHFMTDALLANHDVLGLENDNILTAPSGRRVRLDQGGTLEFRAMGQPKEFGHSVPEVESMMAKPSRQGYRSSQVTMPELRAQAAEIHRTLTPERIDALVGAAPFKDSAMRERVRAALKARVQWMGRFATGGETVSIPHLQEVDLSEFSLQEGVSIQHLWDEAKHPRDEHGRFIEKLSQLKKGETVHLDSKTSIKRDKDGTLRVVRSGGIIKGFAHPADAARAALDRSVKSKDGDSVGGATSHKDFNAYLKASSHQVQGVDNLAQFQQQVGGAPFGGKTLSKDQAEAELSLLRGRLWGLRAQAKTSKYHARAVPTLESREKELAGKVKALGGNYQIAWKHVAHVPSPPSPSPQSHPELVTGDHVHWIGATVKGQPTVKISTKNADGTIKVKVVAVNAVAGAPTVGSFHTVGPEALKPQEGSTSLPQTHAHGLKVGDKFETKNTASVYTVTKSTPTILHYTKDGTPHEYESAHEVVSNAVKKGLWTKVSAGPKVGDVVHNPKNSYQGEIVGESPGGWDLETGSGIKATVPKSAFGPTGNMKVGPHPSPTVVANAPDAKIAPPKGKVAGKQVNGLGEGGGPAPLKALHITAGDKLQMKKGGHIYTVVEPYGSGGGWYVKGPTGGVKYFQGYKRPGLIQKADKTPLKLKDAGASPDVGSWPEPKVGDKFKHKATGTWYEVKAEHPSSKHFMMIQSPEMSSPTAVSKAALQDKSTYSGMQAAAPQKTHAEYVAEVKSHLATSLGGTKLSSASSAVFQTPGGKVLFKKPDGSVWNIETGVQQQVDPNVEPPHLTTQASTLASAEAALNLKKPVASTPPAPPKPDASWDALPTGSQAEGILVKNQGGSGAASLTSIQRQAVSHYTGSGYGPMNTQTRTPRHVGTVAVEKQIVAMDGAIGATGGVPEDLVLWRGVNGKTATEYQQNAQKGGVIRDNGFTSTSVRRLMAEGWGELLLKMRVPKGTKGIYVGPGTGLSSHSGEQEFILKRGTAWEVVDVREEGSKKVLVVEPISGHM
jgi:hypothetical protein